MTAPTFEQGIQALPAVRAVRDRGLTGRGVCVALLDTPVGMSQYFRQRNLDIQPLRPFSPTVPTHGAAVAAALLAVAPGAQVRVFNTWMSPGAAVERARGDLYVAAWTLARPMPTLIRSFARIASRTVVPRVEGQPFPAAVPEVHALQRSPQLPIGPFRFPDARRTFQGLSLAVGIVGGLAALLVESGCDASAALTLGCDERSWNNPADFGAGAMC